LICDAVKSPWCDARNSAPTASAGLRLSPLFFLRVAAAFAAPVAMFGFFGASGSAARRFGGLLSGAHAMFLAPSSVMYPRMTPICASS
jgi:hypothetical protein